MYMYMSVCVSVHMRVCGHLSVDACVWTSVCMRVCGHLSMCTCNCVSVCCVFVRVRGHLCVCASVCVRVRQDMYVQVWSLCECVHDVGCSVRSEFISYIDLYS